jgi:hypothetical protein
MMGWLGDACPPVRVTGGHAAPLDRVCLSRPDREVRASQEVPQQGFSTGPWAQTAALGSGLLHGKDHIAIGQYPPCRI